MRRDKQRIGRSFAKHYRHYDEAAVVQRDMADRLDAALGAAAPELRVHRALEIGVGTGFLTRRLTERYPAAEWWFNDLSPAAFDWLPVGLPLCNTLPGDAEALDYPAGLDLLASASAVQWFEDLPAFLAKAHAVLRRGGVLAIASFARRNLWELAELTQAPLRYPEPEELAAMAVRAGFAATLHLESWEHTLHFPDIRELLDHLRRTGVNGAACGRTLSTPAQLRSFGERYAAAHPTADATLPLTYAPVMLIARA